MSFLTKKILAAFILPIPLALLLLMIGLAILFFYKNKRSGKILLLCGTLILLIFSTPFIPGALLHYLESQYPPMNNIPQRISNIVVLGAGIGGYADSSGEARKIYDSILGGMFDNIGNLHIAQQGNYVFAVSVIHCGGSMSSKSLSLDVLVQEEGNYKLVAGFGSGPHSYNDEIGDFMLALKKSGISPMTYLGALDNIKGFVGGLVRFDSSL